MRDRREKFVKLAEARVKRKWNMRDRREKFVKLAEARVNRTIKNLQLVGNLSNRSAYQYEDEDIRKIFRTLQRELDAAKSRFGGNKNEGEEGFRL